MRMDTIRVAMSEMSSRVKPKPNLKVEAKAWGKAIDTQWDQITTLG